MDIGSALMKKIRSQYGQLGQSGSDAAAELNKYSKSLETKEATGSGSAGGYVGPLFGAEMEEEKLQGGKSDKMTLLDIAKKHTDNPKSEERIKKTFEKLKLQLKKGLEVETEHTEDIEVAEEIVMDHLSEDPKYYDKLKKIEATEATGASSAGQYSGPSFLAKSQKKKDWRGGAKPLYKGGKFVKVKKKCLTFPYCNQGDINALKLTELDIFENILEKLSIEYNMDKTILRKIINEDILKNLNI